MSGEPAAPPERRRGPTTGTSARDDLVLVLVESLDALDGDLALDPLLQNLEPVLLLLLEVGRQIGVHADQNFLA